MLFEYLKYSHRGGLVRDTRDPGPTFGAVGDVDTTLGHTCNTGYRPVREFRHRPLLRVVEGVLDRRYEDVGADAIRTIAGVSLKLVRAYNRGCGGGGWYFFLFARPKNVLAHCNADEIASIFRVVEISDEPPDTQHPDVGGPFTIVKSSLEFHSFNSVIY